MKRPNLRFFGPVRRLPDLTVVLRNCLALLYLLIPAQMAYAQGEAYLEKFSSEELCTGIVAKLASVSSSDCRAQDFAIAGHSHQGMPILIREYPPLSGRTPKARILLLGGTHGDEYSSISIIFLWMRILNEHHSGLFHWLVIPLLNPDSLLQPSSQRTNAQGIDLNRNMPSPDWAEGYERWVRRAGGNPRYYPGPEPLHAPEARLLANILATFRPDALISVHAPLNLVDYDGPGTPPNRLGKLPLRRLGNFPGTLGHYGGLQVGIPVVTIELPSSARMPPASEISAIWTDLVRWLINHVPAPFDSDHAPPLYAGDDANLDLLTGK